MEGKEAAHPMTIELMKTGAAVAAIEVAITQLQAEAAADQSLELHHRLQVRLLRHPGVLPDHLLQDLQEVQEVDQEAWVDKFFLKGCCLADNIPYLIKLINQNF